MYASNGVPNAKDLEAEQHCQRIIRLAPYTWFAMREVMMMQRNMNILDAGHIANGGT
jgi:hypothetical protein